MRTYKKNNPDKTSKAVARSFFSKENTVNHKPETFFKPNTSAGTSLIQKKCKNCSTDGVIHKKGPENREQIQTKSTIDMGGDSHTCEAGQETQTEADKITTSLSPSGKRITTNSPQKKNQNQLQATPAVRPDRSASTVTSPHILPAIQTKSLLAYDTEENQKKDKSDDLPGGNEKTYSGGSLPLNPPEENNQPGILPKLTVGLPNDKYEQEADTLAERVVQRMQNTRDVTPESTIQRNCITPLIQREEEEPRKNILIFPEVPVNEEIQAPLGVETVQANSYDHQQVKLDGELSSRIMALRSGGQSMSSADRSEFENHFGTDFSGIRIHTDSRAGDTAKDINAKAYTIGKHVVFGANQYAPNTTAGKKLIAHELAHTIQQGVTGSNHHIQRDDNGNKQTTVTFMDVDYKVAKKKNQDLWSAGLSTIKPFHDQEAHPFQSPRKFYKLTTKTQDLLEKVLFTIGIRTEERGVFSKNLVLALEYLSTSDIQNVAKIRQDIVNSNHFLKGTLQRFRNLLTTRLTGNLPLTSNTFKDRLFYRYINMSENFALKKGKTGYDVVILQTALRDLQYNIPDTEDINGVFEEKTESALMSFQRDVGFAGGDVDGVLGHATLQKLDERFSARNRQKYITSGAGNYVLVRTNIGKTFDDSFEDKKELVILVLMQALEISRIEATKLVPQTTDDIGKTNIIWWEVYKGVTEEEKNKGYTDIFLSRDDYEKYRATASQVRGEKKTGEEIEKQAKEDLYKLQGKKKLYQLYKEMKHLEEAVTMASIGSIASLLGTPLLLATTYSLPLLKSQYAAKKALVEAELTKLGITLDIFEQDIDSFLESFRNFAVLTAVRMLDRNETKTLIAKSQLEDTANIAEIKSVIQKLVPLYQEAETNWWKGVSLHVASNSWQITGDETLDGFIEQAAKTAPHVGGMISSVDMAYKTYAIYRYKDGKQGFLNDFFKKAQEAEQKAHSILAAGAQKYNILAFPDLDLKDKGKNYVAMSDKRLQATLDAFISEQDKGVLTNISTMKRLLQQEADKIWELKPVWTQAMRDLGLTEEDPQYQVILKEVERRKSEKMLRDILLAVGGIALGLLALASGPVGWAALAGSIVVGSIDAYIQYQEISFTRTARRTALDPQDALSDVDQSWVWFYLSLAGIGLDLLDVVKFVKVAKTAKQAKALVDKTSADLLEEAAKLTQKGTPEALQEADKIRKLSEEFTSKQDEFAENLTILLKLENEPLALLRLSEVMVDKKVAKAMKELGKLLGEESEHFMKALRYYGGIGSDLAGELPEVIRVIRQGRLNTQADLLDEILTQPSLQKVLLDNSHDPRLLTRQWEDWVQAGRQTSFISHLKKAGFDTDLTKGVSLSAEFGGGFGSLTTLAKNRQVLRHIEPKLADALDAGKLPPDVQEIVLRHLGGELIGETDDLSRAGKRLQDVVGPLIGGELKTNQEFAELVKFIKDPEFIKKIFSGASNLPGKDTYSVILAELIRIHKPSEEVLDELARIGVVTDKSTLETLMTNKNLREALAKYPAAMRVLKRCASPCFPSTLEPAQIEKLNALLGSKGPTADQFRRLNEYIYLHREFLERGKFDEFFLHLEKHFDNIVNGDVGKISNTELLIDPISLSGLGAKISGAEASKLASAIKSNEKLKDLLVTTNSKTLISIFNRGIPEQLLTDIITIAAAKSKSADEIKDLLEQINKAAGIAYSGEMRQLGKVFYGLADAKTFDQADRFLDMMKNFDKSHAEMFDDILARLEFSDMADFMARFPTPVDISKPIHLRVIAHFKSLIDENVLEANHIATLAKKLQQRGGRGITMDDLLELKRVLGSATFRRAKYRIKYIQGKLINEQQNLQQFIRRELKDKSITTEIISNIRIKRPNVSLEEALEIGLKDPGLSFFNSLPNGTKQLAILANTEPDLAIMLEKIVYGTSHIEGKLGIAVTSAANINAPLAKKLASVLEGLSIPDVAKAQLGTVRGSVVKQVNKALGEGLDITEIRKLDDILEEQGSRGSIFEHWLMTNKPGALSSLKGKKTLIYNNERVILDNYYDEAAQLVAVEAKNLLKDQALSSSGHQFEQLQRYAEMVNDSVIKRVEYIFSNKKAAEKSLNLIQNTFAATPGGFKVFYIDSIGNLTIL